MLTHEQLQTVFPNATDQPVPESHRQLFGKSARASLERRRMRVWVWAALQVLLPVGLAAAGYVIAAAVAGGVLLLVPIIWAAVLWGRAGDQFWTEYALARGFSYSKDGLLHADAPLFRKGDKRECPYVLEGVVGGTPAALALYTYTEISHDSDGDRQETDYDFTICRCQLPPPVAARYRGVYLRANSISFGALQDKLQHDRGVQLESVDFNKRYDLRVDDDQDDIALYELFSTTFIDQLCTEFEAYWEQRGADLVVFVQGHKSSAAELDDLCQRAARVAARYLEEYQ